MGGGVAFVVPGAVAVTADKANPQLHDKWGKSRKEIKQSKKKKAKHEKGWFVIKVSTSL